MPESNPNVFYTWTVELSVSAPWVADGFNLEDDDAVAALLLEGRLSHCRSDEVKGRILKAPPAAEIAYEQGETPVDLPAMKALVKLSEAQRETLLAYGRGEIAWSNGPTNRALVNRDLLTRSGAVTDRGWCVLRYPGMTPFPAPSKDIVPEATYIAARLTGLSTQRLEQYVRHGLLPKSVKYDTQLENFQLINAQGSLTPLGRQVAQVLGQIPVSAEVA